MRETQEIERLGTIKPALFSAFHSEPAEHDEPGLAGTLTHWTAPAFLAHPTSPRSPLSFRTAGFPQYGWKAGLSDGAFPECRRLKPAPGIYHSLSGCSPPC